MNIRIFIGIMSLLVISFLPLARSLAMPPMERMALPNGPALVVFQDHSIPVVTFELLISAGSWRDPQDKKGLANLTVKSILLGTKNLSFDRINERLDFLGANLEAECKKDFATVGMQMLKKDLDDGLGLFLELVTSPSFPASDVAREKDNILGKLQAKEDDPLEVANRAFEKALFLSSPYAWNVEGDQETLAGITPDDLAKFYGSFFRPNNSILVIGGDITPEEVKARIVPKLQQWQAAEIPEMQFLREFASGMTTVKIDRPISQASVVIGNPGMYRADRDYYAFTVLNQILGSGNLSSRLMEEIRIKKGLAYAVESLVLARKHAGSFRILLQTKNESAREAIALAVAEMERLQREPVSEVELKRAKDFLIGNFPLKFSSRQEDYAKFLAQVEFYGLGADYPDKYASLINAVTAQDILRVAKQYLKPEGYVMVVVADLKKAGLQ